MLIEVEPALPLTFYKIAAWKTDLPDVIEEERFLDSLKEQGGSSLAVVKIEFLHMSLDSVFYCIKRTRSD